MSVQCTTDVGRAQSSRPGAPARTHLAPSVSVLVDEGGVALVIALLAMMLLSALGLALSLATSTESRISAAHSRGAETFYAVDAAVERAVHDLSAVADWDQVLSGATTSTLVDGPAGPRVLPDGSVLDLVQATAMLACGRATCSAADIATSTAERPWGANNPSWQLYAHGHLADMSPSGAIGSDLYVVVWVADDPLENDGQPMVDGDTAQGENAGAGIIQVLAHAYGLAGTRRVVEITLKRADARVRVLSWRERRR